MDPLQAFWHVANFFAPALAVGALSAAFAKLAWRRELAGVPWRRLALPAAGVCAAVVVAGLMIFGRDGRMATYAAMVGACAAVLWWRGFGPGARR